MNMIGRKSSIHQVPMPRRAVPALVEFVKGSQDDQSSRSELWLPSRSTQPIPIKKCRLSPQESEEEATSQDSATHYDWATWRMYDRIMTARRLRAVSRGPAEANDPVVMTRDYHVYTQERMHHSEDHISSHIHHGRMPSTAAEDINDAFFLFDDM